MQLFVGLGNPGASYAGNRHNIGFMVLDRIAADHGFAPWRSKFEGLVAEGALGSEKVLLLKPQTFMNRSGQSVGLAMRFHKIPVTDVTVFHDEIDLAPGAFKVKQSGGHAGHNGLRSLHAHIGPDYGRVRLGVGHPGDKDRVADFVLADFSKTDTHWLDQLLGAISQAAPGLAAGDAQRFQADVAKRLIPPSASASAPPQAAKAAMSRAQPDDEPAPAEGPRSVLQRLVDRFR